MPRNRLWLSVVAVLILSSPLTAQFRIERAKEDLAFQTPRTFTLYTNSHFNRVEAFYLNLGVKFQPPQVSGLALYGDVGYGFKNEKKKRWRWHTGAEKKFFVPNQLTIGAEYFYDVDTNDRWLISEFENSLAGIFLHEDFMDYFDKKGARAFADYRFAQMHTLRLEMGTHRYEPLQRNSNWGLFGKNKVYPRNTRTAYPVLAGDEFSFRLIGVFDWRDNPIFPIYGWYADAQIELTAEDFESTALFLTLKRYQPTFGEQKFQVKLLLGSRSGSFAFQHLLGLGGIGNLRAYREKEFIGNRLIYLSADYIVGQEWLRHVPLQFIPIWEAISIGVFAETGLAWFADPTDRDAGLFDVGDFEWNDLRSDVGISLFVAENLLRVDFARRTDRGANNWRILFRFLDKF